MNINLQYLSKSLKQTTRLGEPSASKTNSGQSQRLSGAETPPPVYGTSFSGQQKRAKGSTPELEAVLRELESFATYDLENGGFRVTRQRSYKYPVGSLLGSKKCKYYQNVTLFSVPHGVANLHWLVWLWHTGSWPSYQLDHINQDKLDNRIENLRDAHRSFNSKNTKLPTDNTSGYIGVSWNRQSKKWRSYTAHMGKTYWHGEFNSIEDAINARAQAIAEHPEWGFSELHGREEVNKPNFIKTAPTSPSLRITLRGKENVN